MISGIQLAPHKVDAKIAVITAALDAGVRDAAVLRQMAGVSHGELRKILAIWDICRHGVPAGLYHPIRGVMRCLSCGSRITHVPCVQCGLDTRLMDCITSKETTGQDGG